MPEAKDVTNHLDLAKHLLDLIQQHFEQSQESSKNNNIEEELKALSEKL